DANFFRVLRRASCSLIASIPPPAPHRFLVAWIDRAKCELSQPIDGIVSVEDAMPALIAPQVPRRAVSRQPTNCPATRRAGGAAAPCGSHRMVSHRVVANRPTRDCQKIIDEIRAKVPLPTKVEDRKAARDKAAMAVRSFEKAAMCAANIRRASVL